MTSPRDPYSVLGVPRNADPDAIKKAYRKLARELHPDRGGDAEKLKEVNGAWEVLSDPERRKTYDEFGADALRAGFDADAARRWKQQAGGFGGFQDGIDIDDLLGMFGGRGGGFGRGPRRGRDARATLNISLREALEGGERSLSLGAGGQASVRIPKGIRTGQTLRVAGRGGPGADGGPPGDLLLDVEVGVHPLVRVDRDDLEMDLPLSFAEALRGGPVTVPTPGGKSITVRVPAGVEAGTRIRIPGHGLPAAGRGTRHGDLYLVVRPTPPRRLDGLDDVVDRLEAAYAGQDVREALRSI